jgi:hypothetical protein
VYFYELHEGDDELYSDVILAREEAMDPEAFFEIVQDIRRRIQDTHVEDTLIEAIALELERDHRFVYISDDRVSAAVNVSTVDEDNFLLEVDEDGPAGGLDGTEYRTVFLEYADEDAGGAD